MPELMAIGDSIYNGVRSLTISADLAAHSVPAQVARAFGWNFVSPDYKFPMIADFESIFRDAVAGSLSFVRDAVANAHGWLATPHWSDQKLFHNLAIGQQVVGDVFTANYRDSLKIATDLAVQGAALPVAKLPVVYQALNTCFVLNPARTANDKRTAIDILSDADPKRVLVNIGINNGIWTLLLLGDPTDYKTRINPVADMKTLALHLKESCPKVEHFYINLFPKPSAIANLMPPWLGEFPPIPTAGYHDKYIGHLLGSGGISRAQMQEIDHWVRDDLNQQVKAAFAPLGARAHFVDLYACSMAFDRKNGTSVKDIDLLRHGSPILVDNNVIDVTPLGGMGGFGGGLFGLDNLHPTVVGYGLIAQAVCDTIAATEGVPAPQISLQACYDADTLLRDLPPTVALADFALEFIGAFIQGDSLAATA